MMNFKTDTKEKFTVLSVDCEHITANMSVELFRKIQETAEKPPHNVILRLDGVGKMDRQVADGLGNIRENMYEHNWSFVVCELQGGVLKDITDWQMEEYLNITPTESEAWDIVQMDEIEREFLKDEGQESGEEGQGTRDQGLV